MVDICRVVAIVALAAVRYSYQAALAVVSAVAAEDLVAEALEASAAVAAEAEAPVEAGS